MSSNIAYLEVVTHKTINFSHPETKLQLCMNEGDSKVLWTAIGKGNKIRNVSGHSKLR